MELNIVILAAGKGTRMNSRLPKVLQPLSKKPLLSHVLETSFSLKANKVVVVYGHGGDLVKEQMASLYPSQEIIWAEQREQLGTGHAVLQAMSVLEPGSNTLILYGDVPLISVSTLQQFIETTADSPLGLLTVNLDNPKGYGRILRNSVGLVESIVEEKDASAAEKCVTEVNTGIMFANTEKLQEWLPRLGNQNAQGEYYLTDLAKFAADENTPAKATMINNRMEVDGVNDKLQLATLERAYQLSLAEQLMKSGATLADPSRIDIRGHLTTGQDCYIDVNCVFEGNVTLGENVSIGPNCHVIDAKIEDGTVVKSNTVIESAVIGERCDIGPFARIRPGTVMATGAKIGNFVETKNTKVGEGSKINHLSYVGDSELGSHVNVGAGTITCNYDGVNKHKTIIGDNAFIGSNSSLVAPIEIGEGATIGAGSTVSKKAKANALTVTRAKQITLEGWQRPTKKV